MKICVIGASGIGKSTLIEGIADGGNAKKIMGVDGAKKAVVERFGGFSMTNRWLRAASIILPENMRRLVREFLFRAMARSDFRSLAEPYAPLFDMGYHGLSVVQDPVARMKMAAFFYKIAQEEVLIDHYLPEATVLYDDSIIQLLRNFDALSGTLAADAGTDGFPDAVIFCSAPWSVAHERLARRSRRGRTNTAHVGLDGEALEKAHAAESENALAKKDFFLAHGIPVCEVDLSTNKEESKTKVLAFIGELREVTGSRYISNLR